MNNSFKKREAALPPRVLPSELPPESGPAVGQTPEQESPAPLLKPEKDVAPKKLRWESVKFHLMTDLAGPLREQAKSLRDHYKKTGDYPLKDYALTFLEQFMGYVGHKGVGQRRWDLERGTMSLLSQISAQMRRQEQKSQALAVRLALMDSNLRYVKHKKRRESPKSEGPASHAPLLTLGPGIVDIASKWPAERLVESLISELDSMIWNLDVYVKRDSSLFQIWKDFKALWLRVKYDWVESWQPLPHSKNARIPLLLAKKQAAGDFKDMSEKLKKLRQTLKEVGIESRGLEDVEKGMGQAQKELSEALSRE
jgi:hypothetical protein